jgi:hypothetical protein
MWTDPIVDALHAQRRAQAAELGFDVQRVLAALHAAQDLQASRLQAPLVQPVRPAQDVYQTTPAGRRVSTSQPS